MHIQEALLGRRTVHAYRPEPIRDGVIERALAAAILAPNHRLTFPWRFTRIGPGTRAAIADVAVALKKKPGVDLADDARAAIRASILAPAEAIAVSVVRSPDPAIAREDYASAACAIQNLCLSLFGDGVASKWTTGKVTSHPDTYRTLGIDPAREEIVGFVWAGVAASEPNRPARPALESLVRRLP